MAEQFPGLEIFAAEARAAFVLAGDDVKRFEAAREKYREWVVQEEKKLGPTLAHRFEFDIRQVEVLVFADLREYAQAGLDNLYIAFDQSPDAVVDELQTADGSMSRFMIMYRLEQIVRYCEKS